MRFLVICEKNLAASRIAYILSGATLQRTSVNRVPVYRFTSGAHDYAVIGLRGHIVELDYPKEHRPWERTKLKELVTVKPVKVVDPLARNILSALQSLAEEADEIILATDYDREGELIGVEALELIHATHPVKRARFSALTKGEIERAFSNLDEVDYKLASAAETRQAVDLAWGATLTRFLSLAAGRRGKEFLSVGRVQSPTLALLVDRDQEIRQFVPTPYWVLTATLGSPKPFETTHATERFTVKAEADAALGRASAAKEAKVVSYEVAEKPEYPPSPFNTTTFLSEATKLGLSAAYAMAVAENLYTAGFISYPRTDNTVYPPSLSLRGVLERLRKSEFSKEAEELLAQETLRPSRGKVSATDHPPIYPVEAASKKGLRGDRWKVYELVARRFLATVAPPAKVRKGEASFDVGEEPFQAEGHKTLEPGWRRYYPYYRDRDVFLPELREGSLIPVQRVSEEERQTKPAPRYTQGMLLQEMERLGLGTKSTRHEIIQKLYDRKFVEGSNLIPTESGIALVAALEAHARMITESKMTSHLETDMDLIARGESTQEEVVEESQAMLSDILEVLERHEKGIGVDLRAALRAQHRIGKCPQCATGELGMVVHPSGRRYIACSNYPECRAAYPFPSGMRVEATERLCETCKAPIIKGIARGQPPQEFCINPECPTTAARRRIGVCPKDGGELRLLTSRRGKRFVGCANYPTCTVVYPLPQLGKLEATGEACEACGAPKVTIYQFRRRPWTLCINMECPTRPARNRLGAEKKRARAKKPSARAPEPVKPTPSEAG